MSGAVWVELQLHVNSFEKNGRNLNLQHHASTMVDFCFFLLSVVVHLSLINIVRTFVAQAFTITTGYGNNSYRNRLNFADDGTHSSLS